MLAFKDDNDQWVEWTNQPRPRSGTEGMFRLPGNAEAALSPDELAGYGLFPAMVPEVPDGKRVTSQLLADVSGVPVVQYVLEDVPAPVPADITRRQCASEMFSMGLITGPEAIAMTATATPPGIVETMLVALPEPAQTLARIDFAASTYARDNALLGMLVAGAVPGTTEEDIDQFFVRAAAR